MKTIMDHNVIDFFIIKIDIPGSTMGRPHRVGLRCIDAHREIASVDTLKASRMLMAWVSQGLLEPLPDRAKRNTAYSRPAQPVDQASLLSDAKDNKL